MKSKIHKIAQSGFEGYLFLCPGCGMTHLIPVFYTDERIQELSALGRNCDIWKWNDRFDKPTFRPDFRLETKYDICHFFLTRGKLKFLPDTTHHLRNQIVEMADVEI